MRKWKIGVVCLVVLAVGAAVLAKDHLNRKVILLQNGKVIPVNRTWESGNDIFYENDKQTHFISRADIKYIGTQSLPQVLQAAGTDCMAALNRCVSYFDPLLQDGAAITHQVKVHPGITTAVLVFGVLLFSVRFVRSRYPKKPLPQKAPASKETVPELPTPHRYRKVFFVSLSSAGGGRPRDAGRVHQTDLCLSRTEPGL